MESKFTYNDWGIISDGEGSRILIKNLLKMSRNFGVDNSLSSHTCHRKIKILVLGEGPIDGINGSIDRA